MTIRPTTQHDIQKDDENITRPTYSVVQRIFVSGSMLGFSYTGADVGTGEVMILATGTNLYIPNINHSVTLNNIATIAANTLLANPTAGAASPSEVSITPDTTWSPTWGGLSVGNGTLTTGFIKIGKLVIGHLELVFGNTTSISGDVTFSPPVNQSSGYGATASPIGTVRMISGGGAAFSGVCNALTTSSFRIAVSDVSATYLKADVLSSIVPGTWTTNDVIEVNFSYFST